MIQALRLGVGLPIQLALALLPGFALGRLLRRVTLAIVLTGSGLVALVSFYATYASPTLGRSWTYAVLIGSFAVLARWAIVEARRRRPGHSNSTPSRAPSRARSRVPTLALSTTLTLGVGWVLLGSLALHGGYGRLATVAGHRYLHPLPIDSLMPELLADRVLAGEPVTPFVGEWLSSDRPPLQAGFTTFVRPVRFWIDRDSQYEVLSIGLQLLVLPCLWLFLFQLLRRSMDEHRARIIATASMLMVAFSGLTILHATFVWPKLLGSAFAFLACAELLETRPRWRGPTIGACIALGMMSHGSVVFAMPIVFCFAVFRIRSIREPLAILAVAFLVMAPWNAYQRWADPPGNRLLKWHLAGVIDIDSRSTLDAIRDEYAKLSLADIAHYKRLNLSVLYNHQRVFGDVFPFGGSMPWVRSREFVFVANSLGIAWVAVPFALAAMVRSRWRRRSTTTVGASLYAVAILSLGVWCTVMFGPGTTSVHVGALAVPILLMVGLVVASASVHPLMPSVLAALSIVRGLRLWLLAKPIAGAGLDPKISRGAAALMLAGGVVVAVALAVEWRGGRARLDDTTDATTLNTLVETAGP